MILVRLSSPHFCGGPHCSLACFPLRRAWKTLELWIPLADPSDLGHSSLTESKKRSLILMVNNQACIIMMPNDDDNDDDDDEWKVYNLSSTNDQTVRGMYIDRIMYVHGRAEIWNFSSSVQDARREVPYLQATMYCFVYYINTLVKRRRRSFDSGLRTEKALPFNRGPK